MLSGQEGSGRSWKRGITALESPLDHPEPYHFRVLLRIIFFLFLKFAVVKLTELLHSSGLVVISKPKNVQGLVNYK